MSEYLIQGKSRQHFDRSRRRKPGTDRKITGKKHIHAGKTMPVLHKMIDNSQRVIEPLFSRFRIRLLQMQVRCFGEFKAMETKSFIRIPGYRQISTLRNSTGQYPAAIIIYMLADQVDPTGTEKQMFGFLLKTVVEFFYQSIFHRCICPILNGNGGNTTILFQTFLR